MKPTNLTIRDLITPDSKLTFLIGAGCSIDPPSCLPAGPAMMNTIIEYTCAESEIEEIKKLSQLRFEALVEIIRDCLDPDLKIIDFYGLCDKPNIQHFFLAEMIKKGHFTMTTNFDFLIEQALLQSEVSKDDIKVVITKADFEKFNNPNELFEQGKKTVYKIHGSTKNIISGEKTKDSLVATIQAFGSNKEGENIFQIEPFKRLLFDNISNERSLVVIGYSGSDDFDVVPTLKVLENLKNVIWINHIQDDNNREQIYEIDKSTSQSLKKLAKKFKKVTQILLEIWRMKNAEHIYRMDVNIPRIISKLMEIKPKISLDNFSINAMDWLKINIKLPSEMMKYYISYKIYWDLDIYDKAMACSENSLRIAEDLGVLRGKAIFLNAIGRIHDAQGNYREALKRYEEALQIAEQLRDLSGKATFLNNIGRIHDAQGNYPEALKLYKEALQIDEQLGDLSGKATSLNNIGSIYKAQGNYPEALKLYEGTLQIVEQLGDLSGKAYSLNNIGVIHYAQGNYPEALKRYEEALQINEQLGDLSGKATSLNNIGEIYRAQGNYPEALKQYEEALQINEQLGDLSGKATSLNNIGVIHYAQGNYPEALRQYEGALQIDEQLGNLSGKATSLNNIGEIYRAQGNYPKALKRYEESLQIAEQLRDLSREATSLNNIGGIYRAQGNYPKALKQYEEALQIAEQLGDLNKKAYSLNNIGRNHDEQGNYPEALKRYEEALQINEQLGDLSGKATSLNNIGGIYYVRGNYPEALKKLEEALEIFTGLGLSESLNAKNVKKNINILNSKIPQN
jgi:tetratricopeptide (TPR) repeat protein